MFVLLPAPYTCFESWTRGTVTTVALLGEICGSPPPARGPGGKSSNWLAAIWQALWPRKASLIPLIVARSSSLDTHSFEIPAAIRRCISRKVGRGAAGEKSKYRSVTALSMTPSQMWILR